MNLQRENLLKSRLKWFGEGANQVPTELGIFRDLYTDGKTFSILLEEIKSENTGEQSPYYGMSKLEALQAKKAMRDQGKQAPLTAFEEALLAAGLYTKGDNSDYISKFFEFAGNEVLFQEFITDRVYSGMMLTGIAMIFTALSTNVDSDSFEQLYMEDEQKDQDLYEIAKYEDLPKTTIKVGKRVGRLGMYGRYLELSRFDKARTRANVLGRFLENIGDQIGAKMTDLALYRLLNDTTAGVLGTTTASAPNPGESTLKDKVEWSMSLQTPYKLDKFIGRKADLVQYYTDLYDPQMTSITATERLVIFPDALEWDRPVLPANIAVGVDSRRALEYVHNGGVQTDQDVTVRNLTEGMAIFHLYQFRVIDNNARRKWDLT